MAATVESPTTSPFDAFVDDPRNRRIASAIAGLAAFFWVIHRFFPAPAGVIFQGAVIGSITSFVAFGIALIYRSNRIINFAQGDLGGVPSALGVLLILGPGLPFLLAFPIAIVTAIALGSLIEVAVLRRFFKAPRLILTVVTIGVSQILAGLTTILPNLFDLNSFETFAPPIDVSFSIGRTIVQGNEILALISVPIVIAGLTYLLRGTNIGIAIRASAESADRAALLGVPVKRVQNIVWIIATVLATIGIFLRAGIVGLPIGAALGPTILVRTLTAAVIGRMEKLPTIFVASVALGVFEACVIFSDENTTQFKVDALLFVVVLAALLLQRRGRTARGDEASGWQAAKDTRPIPRELRHLPEIRIGVPAAGLGLLGLVAILPFVLSEAKLSLASSIAIICMVAVSLVVLTGWAGQVSLGQVAFMGIGAAVGGWLTTVWDWDLSVVLVASGVVGAISAMIIGLPALRIQGLFLAVATLSFALAMSSYGLNRQFVSWLPTGRIPRNPLFGRISVESETRFFYLVIVCLVLSMFVVRGIRQSRTGRVLIGVRENERGAQSFGINAVTAKLTAFAISGFIASFAGALFVHQQQALGQQPFVPARSFQVFILIVIGGLGSLPGAILGPVVLEGMAYFRTLFPDMISDILFFLTTGVGVIVILLFLPGGFSQLYYGVRDKLLRRIADNHDIHVPSLVADSLQDDDRPPAPDEPAPVTTDPGSNGSGSNGNGTPDHRREDTQVMAAVAGPAPSANGRRRREPLRADRNDDS